MAPSSKELYFLPLGGSGEIGMNLNLYRYEDKWLMVDCGVTFGSDLGIEVIMPDTQFIEQYRDDLVGLVLTHGHEDHIGAVPYLWAQLQCPIYTTPFTAALVRNKLKEAGLIKEASLVEVPIGGDVKLGPFDIEFITLTHSIPEPNALAIKTPVGTIVHSGDWKLDPHPMIGESADEKRLKELGDDGVLALVCDSTNVFVEGRTQSEGAVRKHMIDLVGKQKERVAIALFASNVARFETCALAAQAHDRQVVLVGRSLHRIYQAARETGYLLDVPEFINEQQAANLPRDKVMILCTGSQGEPRAALTRIADDGHPQIKLESGDTVIFSSRQIPGNELAITALQTKLQSKGIEVISDGEEFTHVSVHPARDELRDMYKLVRPEILVPVHGEQTHMHEQAALGLETGIKQAIVPFNGSLIRLTPGAPEIIEEVHSGRLALDGNRVVSLMSPHIKERQRLMRDGAAVVTIAIDERGQIGRPQLSFVGLTSHEEEEGLLREGTLKEMAKLIEGQPAEKWESDQEVTDMCRIAVRRAVRLVCGRKPYVVTHIVRS